MPQASDELRKTIGELFGDEIDDWPPTKFLLSHGFTEKGGWWTKPTPSYSVTATEYTCLNFLCDEWDHAYDFSKVGES
jgi:hypothetical protein